MTFHDVMLQINQKLLQLEICEVGEGTTAKQDPTLYYQFRPVNSN